MINAVVVDESRGWVLSNGYEDTVSGFGEKILYTQNLDLYHI